MSSHSESFSVLRLIHTWCVWRYSIQQTVALPKRDRIIPISVLTKSTAESADCCSECEWVFSCEETLGHLVSFTYDLHPFIFNVKSATSRGCLVERDLVATVWKGLSCWSAAAAVAAGSSESNPPEPIVCIRLTFLSTKSIEQAREAFTKLVSNRVIQVELSNQIYLNNIYVGRVREDSPYSKDQCMASLQLNWIGLKQSDSNRAFIPFLFT